MGRGRNDWRWWLKMMTGHLRNVTVTGGTGGDETEVGVAFQLLPWVQNAHVWASLSKHLGTWSMEKYLFTIELALYKQQQLRTI